MPTTEIKRSARIRELLAKYPEPWVIEKEPHSYNDGTKEFTHVRYRHKPAWGNGEEICVEIGSHVTPDLAELLVLLREAADHFRTDLDVIMKINNELREIVLAARDHVPASLLARIDAAVR